MYSYNLPSKVYKVKRLEGHIKIVVSVSLSHIVFFFLSLHGLSGKTWLQIQEKNCQISVKLMQLIRICQVYTATINQR